MQPLRSIRQGSLFAGCARSKNGCQHFVLLALACVLTVAHAGCGYSLGSQNQPYIRSVHVPIFTSDSYRRGLEYQITEAVQREIKQRTPFRLTDRQRADTVLRGHIIELRKDVLGETRFDDPREVQLEFAVAVTWEDARTGNVIGQQQVPVGPEFRHLVSQASMAPEVGQSLASSTKTAVDRLAAQVVDMMELPW